MNFCTSCGKELSVGSKFCGNCGTAVSSTNKENLSSKNVEPVEYFCPHCGDVFNNQDGFNPEYNFWKCRACGEPAFLEKVYNLENSPKTYDQYNSIIKNIISDENIIDGEIKTNAVTSSTDNCERKEYFVGELNKCPHCGDIFNAQNNFNPNLNFWKCRACGEPVFLEKVYNSENSPKTYDQYNSIIKNIISDENIIDGEIKTNAVTSSTDNCERKEYFVGELNKCPHCGEVLKAFETICPACNFELRGVKYSSAVKELADKLEKATLEIQRIIIIENFPIPNTKEDIFEFMLLAASNFDASYYAAHLNEDDTSDAWLKKVEQCYRKAKLAFGNHSDFEKIEAIYLEIKKECTVQVSNKTKTRQREERAKNFKKSKFKIVLIIFAVISTLFTAVAFNDSKIFAGIIGTVMLTSFTISFLMGSNIIVEKIEKMHLIPAIIGFILIIPYFSLYSTDSLPTVNYDAINWNEIELKEYIPNLDKKGNVTENTESSLRIEFIGLSESDHNQILKDVKAMGYTNVKFTNPVYYNAYNEEEYYLEVWWHDYTGEMEFYLDAPITMSTIDWSTLILSSELPNISSNEGVIRTNTSENLDMLIDDVSEAMYNDLISNCKTIGFTVDMTVDSEIGNFEAFNSSGTKIEFKYNKFIQNLDIVVEVGESYSTFIWPSTKLVKTLPTPKSNIGKITKNSSYSFTVKVANTSFSDFQLYVNECIEKGYNDYNWWSETSFSGDKNDGCTLTVKYVGNSVMEIHVYNYDY